MANFNDLINGDKPILVDFFAEWCGPCKMMAPILKELKEKIGDKAGIVKIDIDNRANRGLVTAHNVRSVPTLMLFHKGRVLWRQSGVAGADELEKLINEHTGK